MCPGYIDTPWCSKGRGQEAADKLREQVKGRVPLKVASKPEDIAELVTFLASPVSGNMTGEAVRMDAGMHLGEVAARAMTRIVGKRIRWRRSTSAWIALAPSAPRTDGYPITTSGWPWSTESPDSTRIFVTVPAFGAVIGLNVFIASISSSVCPASTLVPTPTKAGAFGSGVR